MRVFVPSTLSSLRSAREDEKVGPAPVTAFAVTPALREWYAESDLEELEYAALTVAARASLRLLDVELTRDPAARPRRVVIAVEVSDADATAEPDLDRAAVLLSAAPPWHSVVSVHVDDVAAGDDVRTAAESVVAADLGSDEAQFALDGAEGHELAWFATQEVDDLLAGLTS